MTSKECLKRLYNNLGCENCYNDECKFNSVKNHCDMWTETISQDLNELEQYKQLEEKLGCSLITIFETLENGAYVKSKEWGLCHWRMPNIWNEYDSSNTPKSQPELQFKKSGRYEYFKIKDYGKTWSLRKEDLEDDK